MTINLIVRFRVGFGQQYSSIRSSSRLEVSLVCINNHYVSSALNMFAYMLTFSFLNGILHFFYNRQRQLKQAA